MLRILTLKLLQIVIYRLVQWGCTVVNLDATQKPTRSWWSSKKKHWIHYTCLVVGETGNAHGRRVMNYWTCWYNLCSQSYQLLHASDCAVRMAQGVCQPIHSITSLAVPIETDSNASTEGETKEREGRQGGEEEGLAKKDREETERRERAREIARQREACELHINPVGSDPSQQAPFSSSRKTPYRTMETQRNGPAMPQTPHYHWQRLYWGRRAALICTDRPQVAEKQFWQHFLEVCELNKIYWDNFVLCNLWYSIFMYGRVAETGVNIALMLWMPCVFQWKTLGSNLKRGASVLISLPVVQLLVFLLTPIQCQDEFYQVGMMISESLEAKLDQSNMSSQQHSVNQWVCPLPGQLLISSSHTPQWEKRWTGAVSQHKQNSLLLREPVETLTISGKETIL